MSLFGNEEFSSEEKVTIRRLLEQKLSNEHLATRPGANGMKFTYVESWKAIELANSIFGFNGWSSSIVDITPDFMEEVGGKFRVGVTAVVRVSLKDGTFHEDVGYGISENKNKGIAIENAKKEAVSDARKRALRLFGNALGNCIYDKEHINRVKSKVKSASSSTVSYEQLRLAVDPSPPDPESNSSNSTVPLQFSPPDHPQHQQPQPQPPPQQLSQQPPPQQQQQQQQQQQPLMQTLSTQPQSLHQQMKREPQINGHTYPPTSNVSEFVDEIDDMFLSVSEESNFVQNVYQKICSNEKQLDQQSHEYIQPIKQHALISTSSSATSIIVPSHSINGAISRSQAQNVPIVPTTAESFPPDKKRRLL